MKTSVIYRSELHMRPNIPYPNAASKKELLNKFLDLLLVGAIGSGLAAILLFLLVLA